MSLLKKSREHISDHVLDLMVGKLLDEMVVHSLDRGLDQMGTDHHQILNVSLNLSIKNQLDSQENQTQEINNLTLDTNDQTPEIDDQTLTNVNQAINNLSVTHTNVHQIVAIIHPLTSRIHISEIPHVTRPTTHQQIHVRSMIHTKATHSEIHEILNPSVTRSSIHTSHTPRVV